MKIAIIGYGHVGKAMHKLFTEAYVYDKYLNIGNLKEVQGSDAAFVCVPTPQGQNGKCDTSIVEEVIRNVDSKLFILRSTVYIGFTDEMSKKYKKNIVFQPEYYGETVAHPFRNLINRNWISIGGNQNSIDKTIEIYKTVINSNTKIFQASAKDVELAKYMENSYLALKVTFMNEVFDIANSLGANFNVAREIWLADPRITPSHTFVYENKRGYSGKCLPKDIANFIFQGKESGANVQLLESIVEKNKFYNS